MIIPVFISIVYETQLHFRKVIKVWKKLMKQIEVQTINEYLSGRLSDWVSLRKKEQNSRAGKLFAQLAHVRCKNVVSVSMQRFNVASILKRRFFVFF